MKKIVLLLVIFLGCFVTGCANIQESSLEEAKYVASQQPDFGSFIQAISVSSGYAPIGHPGDPFLWQIEPEMKMETGKVVGEGSSEFVHLIIYESRYYLNASPVTTVSGIQKKTADKKYYLLILNDDRPPKIVAKKELFSEIVLLDK